MGFVAKLEVTETFSSSDLARYNITLARPDAFIGTGVLCLQNDGTDSAGGYKLILYREKFSQNPHVGFQLADWKH